MVFSEHDDLAFNKTTFIFRHFEESANLSRLRERFAGWFGAQTEASSVLSGWLRLSKRRRGQGDVHHQKGNMGCRVFKDGIQN